MISRQVDLRVDLRSSRRDDRDVPSSMRRRRSIRTVQQQAHPPVDTDDNHNVDHANVANNIDYADPIINDDQNRLHHHYHRRRQQVHFRHIIVNYDDNRLQQQRVLCLQFSSRSSLAYILFFFYLYVFTTSETHVLLGSLTVLSCCGWKFSNQVSSLDSLDAEIDETRSMIQKLIVDMNTTNNPMDSNDPLVDGGVSDEECAVR
mmetsp:Transcript_21775/g.47511  ORF Transcript_21775/g.47511 Transcript_21775/m.47511 type:complete len:204 (+) Transcript_21775:109-720(+)